MEKGGPTGSLSMILKKQMKMGYGYGKGGKLPFPMAILMVL